MPTKKKLPKSLANAIAKTMSELASVKDQLKTVAAAARALLGNQKRVHALYTKLKKRRQVLESRLYNLRMKAKGKA